MMHSRARANGTLDSNQGVPLGRTGEVRWSSGTQGQLEDVAGPGQEGRNHRRDRAREAGCAPRTGRSDARSDGNGGTRRGDPSDETEAPGAIAKRFAASRDG